MNNSAHILYLIIPEISRLKIVQLLFIDIGMIKSQFGFDAAGVHVSERTVDPIGPQTIVLPQQSCTTIKGMRTPKPFATGSFSSNFFTK